jgi:predicted neuraminidase
LWKSASRDGGRTWGRAEPFLSDARHGLFNPVAARLADGQIVLFYDPYEYPYKESICLIRSRDSGRTWSAPEQLRTGHAYTTTRGPVVQLRDGKLFLPFCWEESISRGKGPELWNGSCMISNDGGKSWTKGGDVPHWGRPRGAQEPTVVELKNGELFCLLRTNEGRLFQSISRDAGRTWSKPSPTAFASPCACAILKRLGSRRLLLVWNNVANDSNLPRSPLTAAWSDDDGQTWHAKDLAKSDKTDLSNHCVLQLASGEILVAVASGNPVELLRFNEQWLGSEPLRVIQRERNR